jgi:DNA (cytosine-5)-methyltransferase 1
MLELPIQPLLDGTPWPSAAFGSSNQRFAVAASEYPTWTEAPSIATFLDDAWRPLSARALRGFIARAEIGGLRFPIGFLDKLRIARDNAGKQPDG